MVKGVGERIAAAPASTMPIYRNDQHAQRAHDPQLAGFTAATRANGDNGGFDRPTGLPAIAREPLGGLWRLTDCYQTLGMYPNAT